MQLKELQQHTDRLFTTKEPMGVGRSDNIFPLLFDYGGVDDLADILARYPDSKYPGATWEHPLDRGKQPVKELVKIVLPKKAAPVATWRNVNGSWLEQLKIVQKVTFDYYSLMGSLQAKKLGQENRLNPSTIMRFGAMLVGYLLGLDTPGIRAELARFIGILMIFSDKIQLDEDKRVLTIDFS